MTCPRCSSQAVGSHPRDGITIYGCSPCSFVWSDTSCGIGKCAQTATHKCRDCQRAMCVYHGAEGSRNPMCSRCRNRIRDLQKRGTPQRTWWS